MRGRLAATAAIGAAWAAACASFTADDTQVGVDGGGADASTDATQDVVADDAPKTSDASAPLHCTGTPIARDDFARTTAGGAPWSGVFGAPKIDQDGGKTPPSFVASVPATPLGDGGPEIYALLNYDYVPPVAGSCLELDMLFDADASLYQPAGFSELISILPNGQADAYVEVTPGGIVLTAGGAHHSLSITPGAWVHFALAFKFAIGGMATYSAYVDDAPAASGTAPSGGNPIKITLGLGVHSASGTTPVTFRADNFVLTSLE